MKKRGGGVVDVSCRKITRSRPSQHGFSHWLVVHVHIDVCDAMYDFIFTSILNYH